MNRIGSKIMRSPLTPSTSQPRSAPAEAATGRCAPGWWWWSADAVNCSQSVRHRYALCRRKQLKWWCLLKRTHCGHSPSSIVSRLSIMPGRRCRMLSRPPFHNTGDMLARHLTRMSPSWKCRGSSSSCRPSIEVISPCLCTISLYLRRYCSSSICKVRPDRRRCKAFSHLLHSTLFLPFSSLSVRPLWLSES